MASLGTKELNKCAAVFGQGREDEAAHAAPPSQAQASASTVISSMRERAREETLPQIYRQELSKLPGKQCCYHKA